MERIVISQHAPFAP